MVIASEPAWLHAAGQAAGTILLLELSLALLIVALLMIGFAVAAWWLRTRVVPVVREHAPQALRAMQVAQQGSDRVAGGVAEFYGRRQQAETTLRVLLFGRSAAERVREESRLQAAEDLQTMTPPDEINAVGPENGFTPQPRLQPGEITPATGPARDGAMRNRPQPRPPARPAQNGHGPGPGGQDTEYRPRTGNAG
jgi:hypothetical protein